MRNRNFFDYPNGYLHYLKEGEGTAILLLHEMPLSSSVFLPMFPYRQEGFCLIAPDYPGFGDSSDPLKPLSFKDVAEIYFSLMDGCGIQTAFIYGVHGGASLAIEMARQNPDRVKGLILSGVPLFNQKEVELLNKRLPEFNVREDGSHLSEWWSYFENKYKPDASKNMIHEGFMQIMKAGEKYTWGYLEAFNYNPREGLGKLNMSVNLLTSSGDVLVQKNEEVKKYKNLIIEETIMNISGQLSQRLPEETMENLAEFMNGVLKCERVYQPDN